MFILTGLKRTHLNLNRVKIESDKKFYIFQQIIQEPAVYAKINRIQPIKINQHNEAEKMSITRWLQTAEQANKPLTAAELQAEHQIITDLAMKANLSAKGFDADVYDHLLPAMKLTFQHELHSNTLEEQLSYARLSAFKLTILFGNIDKSVAYLKRFEEANPGSRQRIHDACLFSLPSGNQWNNTLWRKIIDHFNVTAPENPILRLFPLAEKIEIYIKDHAKEIIGAMTEDITQYYEHLFSNEWDEEQKNKLLPHLT